MAREAGLGLRGRVSALLGRPVPAAPVSEAEQAAARQQLFSLFESLGENCELGFAQEHFHANPIGLFRWSGISLDHLVTALDSDLAGIGEPEHTGIGLNENNREWFVTDHRYGMSSHTRIHDHEQAREAVFQSFCRRTRRLCEKLVEDLEDAAKIFVFQSRERLSAEAWDRLAAAVHRLGPTAELLCVQPAGEGQRPGQVRRLRPGLMLGAIDKPGFDGETWDISFELWVELLAQAAGLCGRPIRREALGLSPA